MRIWDNINRYLAFKLKEIEFRFHTWKRSREISRAYDTRSAFKVSANFGAAGRYAVKAAKVAAVAAGAFLLVFGAVKAIPLISIPTQAKPAGEDERQTGEDSEAIAAPVQEIPEGAVLPEAAVLPEGYADAAQPGGDADGSQGGNAQPTPEQAASQTASAAQSEILADIFRAGIPRGVSEWLILVDKDAKIMYLFKSGAQGWETARAFPVATGEKEGRKVVEGDKKTPQGVYFIVGRKFRSELTNLYGPAAFILDYPNEQDRREGRTGHGIWIHGSERGNLPPFFTQGCVATSNPDILELAGTIRDWAGIPVVIVSGTEDGQKHLASVDFQRVKSRREEVARQHSDRQAVFERLVMDWKTAWESKDIGAYSAFYSTGSFANGTQKWDAYREHKVRTFAMYSSINIDITGAILTEYTENAATVMFNQAYATNINRMENAKRLIFRKEQGNWKIYREIPFPKEELLL